MENEKKMRRENFGFRFTVCKTEENYDKINLINLFRCIGE